ncbi:MAG: HIT domain-containing protein [Microbacterium sp.]
MTTEDEAREQFARLEPGSEFAASSDGFQRLWTPHRMAYINAGADANRGTGCPFCAAPAKSDEDGLIVHRGEHAFVLMNLFPYNSGHLLVCPYRHIGMYDEADPQETAEIAFLSQTALRVLRDVSGCAGFNLGMNQGSVAGAGVEEHLHQHIVPRWAGDSNFFPIVAHTKALPQLLEEARSAISAAWPA